MISSEILVEKVIDTNPENKCREDSTSAIKGHADKEDVNSSENSRSNEEQLNSRVEKEMDINEVRHDGISSYRIDPESVPMEKSTSRQRSGKGAIRKRFPLQKPRWEKPN